jgi:integrase/recombinase XerC
LSAVTALDPAFVLAEAARLRETAVKDKTYRSTPIGALVGRYLDELAFAGYSLKTVDTREAILWRVAVALAHLEPAEVTLDDLKRVLAEEWAHAARNTKASATSSVRVFFTWAHENEHIPANPASRLKQPRDADTERIAHTRATMRKLIVGQDSQRDRVAILTLYWCGLRRSELRQIQFRHIDLANRLLTVFGKGGRVLEQSIPPQLALELERHILDRQPHPDEYLLHPQKWGRRGRWPDYTWHVIWEDRLRAYTNDGIGAWWRRCVAKAGLDPFPMHEVRHTAGTHFYRTSRDLVATQHFMRHVNPATTARTYIHEDRIQAVADVQRRMVDPLGEEA